MKSTFRQHACYALALSMLIVPLSPLNSMGEGWGQDGGIKVAKLTQDTPAVSPDRPVFDRNHPALKAVIAVQVRHTPGLLAIPEVVGTAAGLTDAGTPAVTVFIKRAVAPGVIPESLEGVPVIVKVTGEIHALKGASTRISTTTPWPSPIPIGVSAGNMNECAAGTIGARVTDGTHRYALSNNHVFARENQAGLFEPIVQPGRYDSKCRINTDYQIGNLAAFVPINFGSSSNRVDAALAMVAANENDTSFPRYLGNSTPSNGYLTPGSTIKTDPFIGLKVQKYGRTTQLTTGTINELNATITVCYGVFSCEPSATFTEQIVIGPGGFSKSGDSGSLVVTNDPEGNYYPVGLLFAGGGGVTIANPIGEVLTQLGTQFVPAATLSIDGK